MDLDEDQILAADDLFYRHSGYVGRVLKGRVVRTLVRGSTIFDGVKIVSRRSEGSCGMPGRGMLEPFAATGISIDGEPRGVRE